KTENALARLEKQAGRPIGQCFDLIAGTSIGGIIALGLGFGHSAEKIRDTFLEDGSKIFPPRPDPPKNKILAGIDLYRSFSGGPRYDGTVLRQTVEKIVGSETILGEALTRLLIPAINMTQGRVQMFKTPHASNLLVDQHLKVADIAMATSAAPIYFPLARIGESLFADGGLVANSPDACAVHEAVHFAGQRKVDIRILSIGTTSTGFGLPASLGTQFGPKEWFVNARLVNTVFGVQQQIVDFMINHELKERYVRLDSDTSAEQAVDIGLDIATEERRRTLLSLAQGCYQRACNNSFVVEMLAHRPVKPNFVKHNAT
ncbi:CBASS cGAMP-activated phospholipase, partial [Methylobacterium platani]|uniref:CBASS cGAMP-activated phospholipase n=1 Tax=Methylobacterium platani TaxID=427683 RepID=UPI000A900189